MTWDEMQDRLPFEQPAPQTPAPEPEEEPKRRRVAALLGGGEIHEAESVDAPEAAKGSAGD